MAKRYVNQSMKKAYEINEKEKKRHYNDRIMQLEHGTFTPLVFSAWDESARNFTIVLHQSSPKKEEAVV